MSRRSRLPSLSALRSFEAAARQLSFTRAAAELHVTQAAVSRQVARLEDELGCRLFRRGHREVSLTRAGEALAAAVGEGFARIREAVGEISVAGEGPLTVAASVGFAALWLMPRMGDFRARHADIDVRVLAADRDIDPATGDADVAIRFCDLGAPPPGGELISAEEVLPVCSPGWLAEHGPLHSLEELAAATLLHLDEEHWSGFYGQAIIDWRRWLQSAGLAEAPPMHGLSFNNYPVMLQAAMYGQGVALGWRPLVNDLLDNGLLVAPLARCLATQRGYFVQIAAQRQAARQFADWLRELAPRAC